MFSSFNIVNEMVWVKMAFVNVRKAVPDVTIIAQFYLSLIFRLIGFCYGETGFTCQTVGGCGIWNKDVNWVNDSVVLIFNIMIKNAVYGMFNV